MNVEMKMLNLVELSKDLTKGVFNLKSKKYEDLLIEFQFHENYLDFRIENEEPKIQKRFKKWLLKEKEMYETFLRKYCNEVEKINNVEKFEGFITGERVVEERIHIDIKYNQFPYNGYFVMDPTVNLYILMCDIPIPINSDGEINKFQVLNFILEEEKIKKMWEPFREKSQHRLKLINILR